MCPKSCHPSSGAAQARPCPVCLYFKAACTLGGRGVPKYTTRSLSSGLPSCGQETRVKVCYHTVLYFAFLHVGLCRSEGCSVHIFHARMYHGCVDCSGVISLSCCSAMCTGLCSQESGHAGSSSAGEEACCAGPTCPKSVAVAMMTLIAWHLQLADLMYTPPCVSGRRPSWSHP